MRTDALERAIRRGPGRRQQPQWEPCAFCAVDLPEDHPHMLDREQGRPLCACRACALLFHRPEPSEGRYRLIPDRRVRLEGVAPADLGAPVGLAFFTVSDRGDVSAHYPSPAGATRWEVDGQRWNAVLAGATGAATVAPEVEALLLSSWGGRSQAWIVPISDCYRLVALVRQHWEGLSGGQRVWTEVQDFFAQMRSTDGTNTRRQSAGTPGHPYPRPGHRAGQREGRL
jgi:Family of unknown function (DUF5947)